MSLHAEDLPLGESIETEPGVVIERRCFLKTAAVAFGAVAVPGHAAVRVGRTARPALSLDQFIAEAVPVARALVADPSLAGQDRYLLTLASYAVQLADVPLPEFRENGPGAFIGANGTPGPFVILHWKLNAGAKIRPHAHTYGNVVTLALAGSAWVENYEVLGKPDYDSDKPFKMRRTVQQHLTPGATNLVNLKRNYVHGFQAGPDGARGLDITTRLHEPRETPFLEIGKPVDGQAAQFEGRWVK